MDPLNKQERSAAIIKVLLFFFIAVIVIAVPMYFAFSLPEKETTWNEQQYEDMFKKLNEAQDFEKQFLAKSDSAIALFDLFQNEQDEMVRDKIQLRYSNVTNQMEDILQKMGEDTLRLDLYDNIIYSFNHLFMSQVDLYDMQSQLAACMNKSQNTSQKLAETSEQVVAEQSKSIQEKEVDLIRKALDKHNGNVRKAAEELGSTERKLRKRMKELGIN